MSNKILWCAIGLLSAVCAAQAYHIRSQDKSDDAKPGVEEIFREQDKWFSQARKRMLGGAPAPYQRFDDLFDDDFFGRRFDPFAEIEGFQKKMDPFLSEEQRSVFRQSWEEWTHDRMGLAEIRPEVKTTGNEVIVVFKIPGLKGESLRIDVNDDRIRLAYDARSVDEKKNSQGTYRAESNRHFEKVMPIPEGADPKTSRIAHEGDAVKITFEKRRA